MKLAIVPCRRQTRYVRNKSRKYAGKKILETKNLKIINFQHKKPNSRTLKPKMPNLRFSRRHLHQYNAGCFYLYIYVLP
ncbi:glycosyltransferase [Neisseria gonorrhoeae]|nr:glycosyltransferase [Neisseria gonorrhoeae]PNL74892.1 glycosyltransferase [Neisseria gonorrhoeae]